MKLNNITKAGAKKKKNVPIWSDEAVTPIPSTSPPPHQPHPLYCVC